MSDIKYLFERVKKHASKAIEAERNNDLTTAFDLYLKAAELLNQMIALEKTQKIRDSYYLKAKEYLKRAKDIKLLLSDSAVAAELKDIDLPPPSVSPPSPPPPSLKEKTTFSPPPSENRTPPLPPPPPPENLTTKIMRGEDLSKFQPKEMDVTSKPSIEPKKSLPPPPKEKANIPTKTTYELLYEEGKYRECILECTKSVEAELRVRLGLFDEQLTLGMLIDAGINKGMTTLQDFKIINIILNRIEHENYRPTKFDAQKALAITSKFLLS